MTAKRPRAYYGACTNPMCPLCGEPRELSDAQPDKAPQCDECGEPLTIYTRKKRKAA